MTRYIVDANLPYFFSLWNSESFIHVFDINDSMTDNEILNYARDNDLTIITKDADFFKYNLITINSENYSLKNRKYEDEKSS